MIEHYELVRKLGSGGSGVVYLAEDTLLMRPVVLKVLKRGALTADQMRKTVLREARMASAIEHPNVCAIYEVGEQDEEAFIAMQYVPGQSLDKLIAKGPANVQLALSVAIQIADGLSAAHTLGIFHRDLKPANVMLTDGGLVKILDFGLARRLTKEDAEFDPAKPTPRDNDPLAATYTARGGTIAYMAPEQFVTGQSSVQSDLWALGVILYELVSGRHPFSRPNTDEFQTIRAIQFVDPAPLNECCPQVPPELASIVMHCLQKTPAERYASAADLREALRTLMKTLQFETGIVPGDAAANLLPTIPEREKRATGLLSLLAERFRESQPEQNTDKAILVLPFQNLGSKDVAPLYGFALADAIGTRLARVSSLIVRPSSALLHLPIAQMDPLAIGHQLIVDYVLTGSFLRSESGFDLNWQLLDVQGESVRGGGSISVASFDLISVQTEICNEVFASLQGSGQLRARTERLTMRSEALSEGISELYLQASAMLSSFMQRTGSRADLDRAREMFEQVTDREPEYAPGWSGLGVTHMQYTRHGFGGHMHIMAARRAFDKALQIDPGSADANLYRIYMLLARGEKESARHGIEDLLSQSARNWNVHVLAGTMLRLDGMYDEALEQFHLALNLNPSGAPMIYNHRARVHQYQNQLDLAEGELQKGLTLEPRHPLLRTSLAYQRMRQGHLEEAIAMMEAVLKDDTSLRIIYPTLAMCYVQIGQRERGATLIEESSMAAAEADSEMAYRLATYFAVDGDESEALHWLRRAIYLGNENYPWFSKNPAWNKLRGHADFERILDDLKRSYRRNQRTWKRLFDQIGTH
jgi:serine/threonine-protein kinase